MKPQILRQIEAQSGIATVTLSNPDRLNAITAAMWRELKCVMKDLDADDTLRCVVLRGAGETFAAGGDIEEFLTQRDNFEQAQVYHGEWVAPALQSIVACRHPCIALIQGPCIGGGLEVAAQCDLRIAGESASFGAPIMKLGFSMAHSELRGLLALAGTATTLEILLEGRLLTASEAYATARRIASGAPLVARSHKRLVRRLAEDPAPLSPAELQENFAYLDSSDYREGLAAFLEKRRPQFNGC